MALPFLACLILTGIHAYLGLHVIECRSFCGPVAGSDCALGAACAVLMNYEIDSPMGYLFSVSATVLGAGVFALTRTRKPKIPQEAMIGIVYAVAAALSILILSRTAEGDEHIREMMVGNILLVDGHCVAEMAILYAISVLFTGDSETVLMISTDAETAIKNMNIRWDLLFYLTFGGGDSSVKLPGFCWLFLSDCSAAVASILSNRIAPRLDRPEFSQRSWARPCLFLISRQAHDCLRLCSL
jgi:zinc/manganese transport system permease protein